MQEVDGALGFSGEGAKLALQATNCRLEKSFWQPAKRLLVLPSMVGPWVHHIASIWEIAIKQGLNRPDFQVDARMLHRGLIDNGYYELPILSKHVLAIAALPLIHKGPLDRLLIAQAVVEGITLLTDDPTLAQYPSPVRLA